MLKLTLLLLLFGTSYGNSLADDFNTIMSHTSFASKIEEFVLNKANNLSFGCKVQLAEFVQGLTSGDVWAVMMLDAIGKLPSGILEGNLVELGSFDECLKVEKDIPNKGRILGKYCLPTVSINVGSKFPVKQVAPNFETVFGVVKPKAATGGNSGIGIQVATCMPNACSAGDIQKIYKKIGLDITLSEEACQTIATQPKLDAGGIATLSFLGVVLLIIVASTIYDISIFYSRKKSFHPMLIAFSVLTNGKKLLTTSNSPNQISCLHGIRVISTMWVILGHRYSIQGALPIKNLLYLVEFRDDRANRFVIGATVAVDTFFLIAGFVISYLFMTSKKELNIIMYYVHRYLRLTPALAVVILIHVTLLQQLGSGPLWPSIISSLIDTCDQYWWKALLYVQNYGTINMCIPQSWYLSVDMQLFIISPILLIPLRKRPNLGLLITGILTICSILSSFLTAWFFEFDGSMIGENKFDNYMQYYYFATWTRAAPWLIGIMLGCFIFKIKQRRSIVINKALVLCLWAASLAVLCTVVFTGHKLGRKTGNYLQNSFYIALVIPAWSIALAWVIFGCVTGYGGPINWFLSLPVFQVVSKFTYSLYLVHYTIIHITTAQMRAPPMISNPREMYIFWGDFAFSSVIAILLTFAFESPIITIEKCIFGPKEEKLIKQPSTSENLQKSGEIA